MLKDPIDKIGVRMFLYSTILSGFTIGLVAPVTEQFKVGSITIIFGIGGAITMACLAGFLCGIVMIFITQTSLPFHLSTPVIWSYRLVSEIICVIVFLGIFYPVFPIATSDGQLTQTLLYLVTVVGVATFSSQRTITLYLRERDIRKKKVGD